MLKRWAAEFRNGQPKPDYPNSDVLLLSRDWCTLRGDYPAPCGPGVPGPCSSTNAGNYFRNNSSMERGAHNMKTRFANTAARDLRRFMAVAILLFAAPLAIGLARVAAADDSANSGEDAALKQVVAGFSDGRDTPDAHAKCGSLCDGG